MRLLSLFSALLAGCLTSALAVAQQTPRYEWATMALSPVAIGTGGGYIGPGATAISPVTGEIFTTYKYHGAPSLGGQLLVPSLGQWGNSVLLRQSTTGAILSILAQGRSAGVSRVLTDGAGNVYATGTYFDRLETSGRTFFSPNAQHNAFVAKWNAAGAIQWLTPILLSGSQPSFGIADLLAVDAAGRVTLAGHLNSVVSQLTINSTVVRAVSPTIPRRNTLYCVQLDGATGNIVWARTTPTATATAWVTDLVADPASGALTLTGQYGDTVNTTFGWDGHLVGQPRAKSFWLRLTAAGAYGASFGSPLPGRLLLANASGGDSFVANLVADTITRTFQGAPIPAVAPPNNERLVAARLSPTGTVRWIKAWGVVHNLLYASVGLNVVAAPPVYQAQPRLIPVGAELYLGGYYSAVQPWPSTGGQPLPPTTTISQNENRDGYLIALDGLTGTMHWSIGAAVGANESGVTCLSVAPSGQIALAGDTKHDTIRFSSITPLVYPAQPAFNAFGAKLVQQYNQVQGTAFSDDNGNGQMDAGEGQLSGLIVETLPAGTFCSTELDGTYSAITDLGARTVRLATVPPYYTQPTAPPAPATFTSYGNIAGGRDFPLQPIPNQQDLQVFVTPVTRARPGFALRYRVTYRNVGTTTLSGTLAVQLDPRLRYVGNFGGGTVSGNVLTATYAALAPQQSRAFDIQFQVPTTVAAGTVLLTTVTIEPVALDLTPTNNTETNRLTVTVSYDPNDIQVNWPRLTPTQVATGEWLEYTIRFENTGTDTAFSVLLRDSLPTGQLNLGTLQFIAWSHNCAYHLSPGGLLTVQFTSIRLPYRNINALGSMGFVRFRVKPRGTLVLGDVVPNRALIHFDYNAPLPTNTALTTVQSGLGLSDGTASAPSVSIWPNPTSGTLNVEAPGAGPLQLTLLDPVGRTVRTLVIPDARGGGQLDVRGLPAGLYLLRGQPANGTPFTRGVAVR